MSDNNNYFTKDNLDMYLKELAKEFRKLNENRMPAEIILIGGAAILANYGFRDMTTDIDAIIHASSSMKEAINHYTTKRLIPQWFQSFFYTKMREFSPSHFYGTFFTAPFLLFTITYSLIIYIKQTV